MESIPANKSCNKHDPPTAKIPEVINNEPNVFNSRHEANESIIFRGQKEKVIIKTSKYANSRISRNINNQGDKPIFENLEYISST